MPVKVACVFAPQAPGLMKNRSMDWAFMRTFIPWSLYSRFPEGAQHLTEKPKVHLAVGSAGLAIRAGMEIRSPSGEKTGSGSSPGIWPPPVTFPGVFGGGLQ